MHKCMECGSSTKNDLPDVPICDGCHYKFDKQYEDDEAFEQKLEEFFKKARQM